MHVQCKRDCRILYGYIYTVRCALCAVRCALCAVRQTMRSQKKTFNMFEAVTLMGKKILEYNINRKINRKTTDET